MPINLTRAWNATYESLPPDSGEAASIGASRIRNLKQDIRERMAHDHVWNDGLTTNSEDGEHSKVTLEQRADPTQLADRIIIYGKDYNNGTNVRCELFTRNEDGQLVMLTDRGVPALQRTRNSWDFAQQTPERQLTDAATIAVDAQLSNAYRVTLTANRTLGLPTNGVAGQTISIRIIQDATGGRTLSLTNFSGNLSDDLALSTGANDEDLLVLYCVSASDWRVISLKKDIANDLP